MNSIFTCLYPESIILTDEKKKQLRVLETSRLQHSWPPNWIWGPVANNLKSDPSQSVFCHFSL